MPYKADGSDVPENIKARSSVKRRQWAQVWNSVYSRCEAENDADCEGRAFAQANAAIQQETQTAEAATLRSYTYNGVQTRASNRRPSSRDDKKYMRDVADGNGGTRIVHYGDPELPMQRDNPERRANFLARHNCDAKRDPFAPGFWACYDWQNTNEEMEVSMDGEQLKVTEKPTEAGMQPGAGIAAAIEHLRAALEALTATPDDDDDAMTAATPDDDDAMDAAPMEVFAEVAPLALVEAETPANRRAPLKLDVGIIKVGPGNQRDRHYYTDELLERDGGVFKGAKMYATDHRNDEKSVRTEVSVLEDVVGVREFADGRYLVGRAVVFNPDFAEDVRNRADAGVLNTLHCSILAKGEATPGKVGEVDYNIVQRITEAQSVDWVTRAGAGGHALQLAESDAPPEAPETPAEDAPLTEGAPLQAVTLSEDSDGANNVIEEVIPPLALLDVLTELGTTNLPASSVAQIAQSQYKDLSEVRAAIVTETARLKAAGSGQPLGVASTPEKQRKTPREIQQALQAVNQKWTGR